MRTIGIFQPYFFAYPAYFALIQHCELFIIHDDVQYIKGGWINRNLIRCNGQSCFITMPVKKSSSLSPIHHRYYHNLAHEASRVRRRLRESYRGQYGMEPVLELFDEVMAYPSSNVADFNTNLITTTAAALGIRTPIHRASQIPHNNTLKGIDKVVDLCRSTGADRYLNSAGGRHLYSSEVFEQEGFTLSFLEPRRQNSTQSSEDAYFSILHHLILNDWQVVQDSLQNYMLDDCHQSTLAHRGAGFDHYLQHP